MPFFTASLGIEHRVGLRSDSIVYCVMAFLVEGFANNLSLSSSSSSFPKITRGAVSFRRHIVLKELTLPLMRKLYEVSQLDLYQMPSLLIVVGEKVLAAFFL